jgi:hypothetical protein
MAASKSKKKLVEGLIRKVEGERFSPSKLMQTLESQSFEREVTEAAYRLGISRREVLSTVLGRR